MGGRCGQGSGPRLEGRLSETTCHLRECTDPAQQRLLASTAKAGKYSYRDSHLEASMPRSYSIAEARHDLAALLHTSARTLHRQLKEEGASLQALKDAVLGVSLGP